MFASSGVGRRAREEITGWWGNRGRERGKGRRVEGGDEREKPGKIKKDSRSVGLEAVGDAGEDGAAAEAVEEGVLPALLLVLLAGLDAEQPAGRRVVLRAVGRRGPGRRRELPPLLLLCRGGGGCLRALLHGARGRPHGAIAGADGGHADGLW